MVARKFHITARGNAERCRAEVAECPLQSEHYATREAAMEAYEAEHSEASVPLVASRKQTAGPAHYRLLEQQSLRELSAIISTAEPLPGADPEAVKRLKSWAAQEAPSLSGVPGMRKVVRGIGSEGDDARTRNRFILDALPRSFELKGKSAVAYWGLASSMSLQDLRSSEDRIDGDRLVGRERIFEDLHFDVDSGKTTVDSYLRNAQDTGSDRLTVSRPSVEEYNRALLNANRVAKEYDRALKAEGMRGYPNSWIEARKELGNHGDRAKAPKVIRISDYGDRLSVSSGLKDRMNRLFAVLAS